MGRNSSSGTSIHPTRHPVIEIFREAIDDNSVLIELQRTHSRLFIGDAVVDLI